MLTSTPFDSINWIDAQRATASPRSTFVPRAVEPTFSIIAPVHNEGAVLPELYRRVRAVMDQTGEL